MALQGWIAIHRKIKSNPIWDDAKPFSRALAWVDLIMRATHQKRGDDVWFMGNTTHLERGELVSSLRILASEWGWSKNKVDRFLRQLVELKMIEKRDSKRDSKFLRIYIVNYSKYQPEKGYERDRKGTRKGQRRDTSNNVNNVNNENKENKEKRFQKPAIGEVKAYCEERKNGIDPQQFVNFYDSKGWRIGKDPMKDWRAAVRTWEQRRKAEQNPKGSGKYDHLITKA